MSSNPPAVPKPSSAGQGTTAIANVRAGYVNLRNGPSTNHRDIGDIRNNTLVVWYPASRTTDGWVWLEQYNVGGWVATSVISFENVNRPAPVTPQTATPFDGKVGLWHWKDTAVPENSIEELAQTIKQRAPAVTQVWVKTNDGADWQGRFDSGSMAINGPADIDRWVQTLARFGLEFHAWCVLKGTNVQAEAATVIQICTRPGVRSMVLDIEPYRGFWQGPREAIRPLMTTIRRAIPAAFHIGMAVDPRPLHFNSIHPQEWFPFVGSVHLQTYWTTFRRDASEVLNEAFQTWGSYGRPLYPILPTDSTAADLEVGFTVAMQRHAARGLSWWRAWEGPTTTWTYLGRTVSGTTVQPTPTPTPQPGTGTQYAETVVVNPQDSGFRSGTYTGKDEFQRFDGTWGWQVLYTPTQTQTSKVWAQWTPVLPVSGNYEISVFVPARHSTTTNARFRINNLKGRTGEFAISVDQSRSGNIWVTLGTFELDRATVNAGQVGLTDVTGETGKEIAFDAVRWRRVVTPTTQPSPPGSGMVNGVYVADGFDNPIGATDAERRGTRVWPQGWADASPYAKLYLVGTPRQAYHTGADLNFGTPYQDLGLPVYAPASGVVIYQADLRPWGNVTIIKHDPLRTPTGTVVYTRYGHMQNVRVRVGQRVRRGEQIGEIGDGGKRFIPHLHYDVSHSTVLERSPGDWPGMDLARLQRNYLDPKDFTLQNRPSSG